MFKSTSRLISVCSRACLLLAAAGATALSACSSHDKGSPTQEADGALGTMSLRLTARGASGALYRLRQGTFQVEQISNDVPSPNPPSEPTPVPFPEPFPEEQPVEMPGPRPSVPPPPIGTGGVAGSEGTAGSFSMGGDAGTSAGGGMQAGSGGASGSEMGGSAGSGTGFFSFLFTEDDPLATTLEANLPSGQFLITLFDGWFLERVLGGEVTVVDARLVSPQTLDFFISANEETFVNYRFETAGEIIDFGNGRLIVDIEVDEVQGGGNDDPRLGVMENSIEALQFSLEETLGVALANAGSSLDALRAYHGIIDSYATSADGRDPGAIHCDEQLVDGQATLNGFPLQCGRLEAQQFDNIGSWFPTAAVSRLDLAPADGSNCGQQRIIFANNNFIGNGRMFIIVESQVPNPHPECGVAACAPLAAFWANLGEIQDPFLRGVLLRDAFLNGSPELAEAGFGPFMNAAHLGPDGGQIRTNNFNDSPWALREFHFQDLEQPPVPVPVAESPNGRLWDDLSGLPQTEECQESFLRAAEFGLLTNEPAAMSFPVAEACKDAESRNDFSEDYAFNLSQGSGDFAERLDDIAAPFMLTSTDLANRARFAGSCIGCHMEAGGSDLGGGVVAPFQIDFVHVSEFLAESCGNGGTCFGVSDALRNSFLPHRQRVSRALLEGPLCGGGGMEPPPVDPPTQPGTGGGSMVPGGTGGTGAGGGAMAPLPGVPSDDPPSTPPSDEVQYTLGGQIIDEHAH